LSHFATTFCIFVDAANTVGKVLVYDPIDALWSVLSVFFCKIGLQLENYVLMVLSACTKCFPCTPSRAFLLSICIYPRFHRTLHL